MFSLANVMKFLAYKLAGLGGSGFPPACIITGPLDCCFVWHIAFIARNMPFFSKVAASRFIDFLT